MRIYVQGTMNPFRCFLLSLVSPFSIPDPTHRCRNNILPALLLNTLVRELKVFPMACDKSIQSLPTPGTFHPIQPLQPQTMSSQMMFNNGNTETIPMCSGSQTKFFRYVVY